MLIIDLLANLNYFPLCFPLWGRKARRGKEGGRPQPRAQEAALRRRVESKPGPSLVTLEASQIKTKKRFPRAAILIKR